MYYIYMYINLIYIHMYMYMYVPPILWIYAIYKMRYAI